MLTDSFPLETLTFIQKFMNWLNLSALCGEEESFLYPPKFCQLV